LTVLTAGLAVFALSACGSSNNEFDKFLEKHKCQDLELGSDGDIDMSCVDPVTNRRVDIEFEANDRPNEYFTDTEFGGKVWVFSHSVVRSSDAYDDLTDTKSGSRKKKRR
jgi:hypothetical protein